MDSSVEGQIFQFSFWYNDLIRFKNVSPNKRGIDVNSLTYMLSLCSLDSTSLHSECLKNSVLAVAAPVVMMLLQVANGVQLNPACSMITF